MIRRLEDNIDEWNDRGALRSRLELRMDGSVLQNDSIMGLEQAMNHSILTLGEAVSCMQPIVILLSLCKHMNRLISLCIQAITFCKRLATCIFVDRCSIFHLCMPRVVHLDAASLLMVPEILLEEVKRQWLMLKGGAPIVCGRMCGVVYPHICV